MDYLLRWEGLQEHGYVDNLCVPLKPPFRSIGISNAILPQSRREGTLWVVEATGRIPNPSPGGWQCALLRAAGEAQ
jgi:hypothetical protein